MYIGLKFWLVSFSAVVRIPTPLCSCGLDSFFGGILLFCGAEIPGMFEYDPGMGELYAGEGIAAGAGPGVELLLLLLSRWN